MRLSEKNVSLNYCRVKGFPFGDEVRDFIAAHERVYVVEQNRDAQLRSLLQLDLGLDPDRLVPVLHYNGMPVHAGFIVDRILQDIAKGRAA